MPSEETRRMEELADAMSSLEEAVEDQTQSTEDTSRRARRGGGGMGGAARAAVGAGAAAAGAVGLGRRAAGAAIGAAGSALPGILGSPSRVIGALQAGPAIAGATASAIGGDFAGRVAAGLASREVEPTVSALQRGLAGTTQVAQQLALGGALDEDILQGVAESFAEQARIEAEAREQARDAFDAAGSREFGINLSDAEITPDSIARRARDVSDSVH